MVAGLSPRSVLVLGGSEISLVPVRNGIFFSVVQPKRHVTVITGKKNFLNRKRVESVF
jgi:hypothetical protein